MTDNPCDGASFDGFLAEEGIKEECTATAFKRVLTWRILQEMEKQNFTKTAMAERMHTSRAQLDRLLNPDNTGVSLDTVQRAASALGQELHISLVPAAGNGGDAHTA